MELRKIWGLSLVLAKTNFKLRNEGSYLGILWYLLNPLLMFLLMWAIFANRLGGDIPKYPMYLLIGIIMFNVFQAVTSESTKIIRTNTGIIKSINFPLESLVCSVVLVALFSHLFEVLMFAVFLAIFKVPFWGLLLYPMILLVFCLFSLGVCLILASLAVYFMDIDNIWSFGSKLLWLATPIFYSIEGSKMLRFFNMFNPLYYFITLSRDIVVYQQMPQAWTVLGALGFTLLSLGIGTFMFTRLKHRFAEMI